MGLFSCYLSLNFGALNSTETNSLLPQRLGRNNSQSVTRFCKIRKVMDPLSCPFGLVVGSHFKSQHRLIRASNSLEQIAGNHVLVTSTAACLLAQLLKPFASFAMGHTFDFKKVIKSGGMPSSHSAVVSSLATSLFLERGGSDPVFGAFVVYACIVMYDAQGVRRAAGKQAEVLNSIVIPAVRERREIAACEITSSKGGEGKAKEQGEDRGWRHVPLKEAVGHTKLEVIVGSVSGVLLAVVLEQLQLFS